MAMRCALIINKTAHTGFSDYMVLSVVCSQHSDISGGGGPYNFIDYVVDAIILTSHDVITISVF